MRRSLVAIDSRVLNDERISDAEYRLLSRISLNFETRLFNADSPTLTKLKVSKATFYRLVVNLVKCEYLQHIPGSSQYSISVSILGLKSLKSETEILNNETGESQIRDSEKEKETEEKRTKKEDKEKVKDINNNIYISTDFSSQKGDTDKVKNESIDTSVEQEDEKKVRRSKEYQEIIKYLNDRTGKRFTAKSRDTQGHISARLDEGFTVDDFKIVIDKKIKEWMGTDMEKYLRPETLFSKKFDRYLNESNIIRHEEKGWDHRIDVPDDPMLDEIWGITLEGKR